MPISKKMENLYRLETSHLLIHDKMVPPRGMRGDTGQPGDHSIDAELS
tara:strand:- start:265 stop:408 length:144 start_codon:yes stop_codon:yes gene_type:complete